MFIDSRSYSNRMSGGRLVNVNGLSILIGRSVIGAVNNSLTIF